MKRCSAEDIKFLYEHKKEILANPEFFNCAVSHSTFTFKLGDLLNAWDQASDFAHVCPICGGISHTYRLVGNPLTGTKQMKDVCMCCGNTFEIHSPKRFLALYHEVHPEKRLDKEISSLSIEDVVNAIKNS